MPTVTMGGSTNATTLPLGFTKDYVRSLVLTTRTSGKAEGDYRQLGLPGTVDEFEGSGFTYDASGVLTGGIITEFKESINGALVFKINDIALSVSGFFE